MGALALSIVPLLLAPSAPAAAADKPSGASCTVAIASTDHAGTERTRACSAMTSRLSPRRGAALANLPAGIASAIANGAQDSRVCQQYARLIAGARKSIRKLKRELRTARSGTERQGIQRMLGQKKRERDKIRRQRRQAHC